MYTVTTKIAAIPGICTNGIVGCGKNNLASNNVYRRHWLAHTFFKCFYTLKDFEVLSTIINEISYSKEELALYGLNSAQ